MTAVEPTTTSDPTQQAAPARNRRDVLCGLVVALAASGALVTACGAGGGDTSGDTSGGDGGAGSGDQGAGGGSGIPLADIPDGGGVVVDNPAGGKVLLTRDGTEVKAFNAACTHQGTILAAPENGLSTCPSHGSQFDTATGAARKGPATEPLAALSVTVEGDRVTFA